MLDNYIDSTFGSGASFTVDSVVEQSDHKILVCGGFFHFNGVASSGIARINANGSIDQAFTTNIGQGFEGQTDRPNCIVEQKDGTILVGGLLTNFNGTAAYNLVRLKSDGSLDSSFASTLGKGFVVNSGVAPDNNPTGIVTSIALNNKDNSFFVGGDFTTFNGNDTRSVAHLMSNGFLATDFKTGRGFELGNQYCPSFVTKQSDGKLLVGGSFTFFKNEFAGQIACLNQASTPIPTPTPTLIPNISTVAVESHGRHFVVTRSSASDIQEPLKVRFKLRVKRQLIDIATGLPTTEETTYQRKLVFAPGQTSHLLKLKSIKAATKTETKVICRLRPALSNTINSTKQYNLDPTHLRATLTLVNTHLFE